MNLKTLIFILSPLFIQAQTQIGQDIDGKAVGDNFGSSVSLSSDGSIVAIGALQNDVINGDNPGQVAVYENQSGTWVQIGQDIDGEAIGDRFGTSVSLSSDGSILAVGAPFNDGVNGIDSGHVRVYENQSGTWVQIGQDIDGEAADDRFGFSVSLSSDGSIVAIGATNNNRANGDGFGHVRVYENQSGTWVQIGQDIDGESRGALGYSVSLNSNGSTVAVGDVFGDGVNANNSGNVKVYENQSGTWVQIGQNIDGEATGDNFGSSISLSSNGSILAIGARRSDGINGVDSGRTKVYENQSGTWVQIGQNIDGEATDDRSGVSVSLSSDGSIVAIGGRYNDGVNGIDSGHVRVYENQSGTWVQIGQDIDGEAENDSFGFSVSLNSNGSILAVGAFFNDGINGNASGHVRIYDLGNALSTDEIIFSDFSLFPNPSTNQIKIQLNKNVKLERISLYNSLGQSVKSFTSDIIDVSEISKGMYLLEIQTNKGKFVRKILVK